MTSYSKTILLGNLTRDPETRATATGQTVTTFDLAVNREYKGKDGTKQKEVLFMRVTAWAKTGEIAQKYLQKGSLAMVEGHLKQRSWDAADGSKRTAIELVADSLVLMPRTGGREAQGQAAADGAADDLGAGASPAGDEDVPF